MTGDKIEMTWLQCTMPKAEWERLNGRRMALGVKWSAILPGAADKALTALEGKKPIAEKPAIVEPSIVPAKKSSKKTAPKTAEVTVAEAQQPITETLDKKPIGKKTGRKPKKTAATEPEDGENSALSGTSITEDMQELADIKS